MACSSNTQTGARVGSPHASRRRNTALLTLALLLTTSAATMALHGTALAAGGDGGGTGGGTGATGYDGIGGGDANKTVAPNLHGGGGGGAAGDDVGGAGGIGGPGTGMMHSGPGGAGGTGGLNNKNGDALLGANGGDGVIGGLGAMNGGGSGGGGGEGGAGFHYGANTDLLLALTPDIEDVLGGKGGTGGKGYTSGGAGGKGGDGGTGIAMDLGFDLIVDIDTVTGGAGGVGGDGANTGAPAVAAHGGTGGAGVIANEGDVIVHAVSVTGGNGGNGGNGSGGSPGTAGDGGIGGAGVDADGGGDVTVEAGTVRGGNGGVGGDPMTSPGNSGSGGIGGAGIHADGDGTVTVEAGTVVVGGNGGLAGTHNRPGTDGTGGAGIAASGGTVVKLSGTVTGGMNAANTTQADAIDFTGGGNTLELASGYTLHGDVVGDGQNGGDALTLGGSTAGSFNLAWLGDSFVGFTGLDKTGMSTWTLTNSNAFTGPTTISQGTLNFDSASLDGSAVTIAAPGTLAANGSSSVKSLDIAGAITLRTATTTLAATNGVVFQAGSTFNVAVDDSGDASSIDGTGTTADLEGGHVLVTAAPGSYDPGAKYVILIDAQGTTGTFDDVTMAGGPSSLSPTLHYDIDNEVYLTFATAFVSVGRTFNQLRVAGALDTWGLSGDLGTALLALDPAQAPAAYDALSGDVYASLQTAMIEDSHIVRDAMDDQLLAPAGQDVRHLWGKVTYDWGSRDGNGNAGGYSTQARDLLLGTDGVLGNWRVGVLGSYGQGALDAPDRDAVASTDSYSAGLYAGTSAGDVQIRGGAALTRQQIDMTRNIGFGAFRDTLSGQYGADLGQVFAELGYKIHTDHATIEPFTSLTNVALHTDGFSETGGNAALAVQSANTDVTLATLGIHASADFTLGGIPVNAGATLGWQHAFAGAPTNGMNFLGSGSFDVAGLRIVTDAALLDATIGVNLAPGATLSLTYGGYIAPGAMEQTGKADLKVKF